MELRELLYCVSKSMSKCLLYERDPIVLSFYPRAVLVGLLRPFWDE